MVTNEPLFYSVQELTKLIPQLSRNSIYAGIAKGEIPSVKVGKRILIPKISFERWLSGNGEANNGKH